MNPLSADFQANASEMNRLVNQLRDTLQTVHKGKKCSIILLAEPPGSFFWLRFAGLDLTKLVPRFFSFTIYAGCIVDALVSFGLREDCFECHVLRLTYRAFTKRWRREIEDAPRGQGQNDGS